MEILCADNKRMNWLALHPRAAQIRLPSGEVKEVVFYGISVDVGVDMREAIDAAMKEEPAGT